jgi:prepilin-type N-terminal cleavage/methylation domain-containing protein
MKKKIHNRKGFTLVEMIVAAVILCLSVLALSAISIRSMSNTTSNKQYEGAFSVADAQLSVIDYIGVQNFIELGKLYGQTDHFGQQYNWKVSTQYSGIDRLYMVKITVSWQMNKKPYSITVDTMLDSGERPLLMAAR